MDWTNIKFNVKDLIYFLGLGGMLMVQYFNLKNDIEKLSLFKLTDDKIINSRIQILEASSTQAARDISRIDKNLYRMNAILPKQINLEEEK
jgi:hypothetical protein